MRALPASSCTTSFKAWKKRNIKNKIIFQCIKMLLFPQIPIFPSIEAYANFEQNDTYSWKSPVATTLFPLSSTCIWTQVGPLHPEFNDTIMRLNSNTNKLQFYHFYNKGDAKSYNSMFTFPKQCRSAMHFLRITPIRLRNWSEFSCCSLSNWRICSTSTVRGRLNSPILFR